jgi:hypothetical protein
MAAVSSALRGDFIFVAMQHEQGRQCVEGRGAHRLADRCRQDGRAMLAAHRAECTQGRAGRAGRDAGMHRDSLEPKNRS